MREDSVEAKSDKDVRSTKPGVLLVSNYSNKTGFAWRNIHRLYEAIAKSLSVENCDVFMSFSSIEHPVDCVDQDVFQDILCLEPEPRSLRSLVSFLGALRRHRIRFLYVTDLRSVDWRYLLYRLIGVKKIVVHCRVSVPDPAPAKPDWVLESIIKYLIARVGFLRADAVYAVSDFVRDRLTLKARLPSHIVTTILNGVPIPDSVDDGLLKGRKLRIVCACRASRYKGVQVLIEAAHILREKLAQEDFLIDYAGDGPDIEFFESLVEKWRLHGVFTFHGETEGTASLVAQSHIVVVPSIWGDACPSAVAEGLAAGKAVVATAVGGVPEQVGDPENGILVPAGDPWSLARALDYLILCDGARLQLGINARRRAEYALEEGAYHRTVVKRILEDFVLVKKQEA
ncbi:MAG: glycosyltransferase [Ectothiorhodospiraceae bacterium]|nr:glycosyltransferase [Ectothiorhodospiraceae bacterium]